MPNKFIFKLSPGVHYWMECIRCHNTRHIQQLDDSVTPGTTAVRQHDTRYYCSHGSVTPGTTAVMTA